MRGLYALALGYWIGRALCALLELVLFLRRATEIEVEEPAGVE
jgi:tetrahydromethanopterin S-methyltransferase subunit B